MRYKGRRTYMRKKLTSAKYRIGWFLNFINSKIDDLPTDQLFSAWSQMREIAYGEFGPSKIPDSSLVQWDERRKDGKEIQNFLKESLQRLLSPPQRRKRPKAIHVENRLLRPEGLFEIKSATDFLYQFTMDVKVKLVDGRFFIDSTLPERLSWEFVSALRGFPKDLIQRCQRQDCEGYFLKATKKEKRYCSNRCAWIVASRERWAARKLKETSNEREGPNTERKEGERQLRAEKK
jgi:hypothetical protein